MKLGQLRNLTKDLNDDTEILSPLLINDKRVYVPSKASVMTLTRLGDTYQSEQVDKLASDLVVVVK